TIQKVLNRLGIVYRHAAAMGLPVDLTTVERVKTLLGKAEHVERRQPSMPWQEVPAFYETLSDGTIVHLALRLLIFTGQRSYPVRFAHVDQFDFDQAIWVVPAANLKGKKLQSDEEHQTGAFRVPLSPEAIDVVKLALGQSRDGWLFPGARRGVISDASMSRLMERRGLEARPHGFRSSLRTWLSECTDASHEIAETCLQHTIGNKVSRAYDRQDYLEKRRPFMLRWSEHCTGQSGADVLAFAKKS
ncbi:MAG: site-specific integrase, partial [Pseudomonadota bacterium]